MYNSKTHTNETTAIITGVDAILEDWKEFTSKAKKLDVYFDKNAVTIAILSPAYRDAYIELKKKGVKTRIITEITKENLNQSKVLLGISGELRHLEGTHGGMALSDTTFKATASFQDSMHVKQAITSNNTEFVNQQQHIFNTLWDLAIPAERRIGEIEGRYISYKTEIITNQDKIISETRAKLSNSKELKFCLDSGGVETFYKDYLDFIQQAVENSLSDTGKGVKIMTSIDNENKEIIEKFLQYGVEIRHVKNLPPMNFAYNEKHAFVALERMRGGMHVRQLLYSNEPIFRTHFISVFDKFWKTGIDARNRLADIERGGSTEDIEIIYNTTEAKELLVKLLKSAQKEIKVIFPTINAFLRQKKFDVHNLLIDAANRGVTVRIISGRDEIIEEYFAIRSGLIQIRFLEKPSEIKTTVIMIDGKYTMDLEIKDDSNMLFEEAIGFCTYSSSKASIHSHIAIFDNLWIQSKLYEELKESNKLLEIVNQKLESHYNMQKEFINIAAHELRTPIQPILGLSEILRSNSTGKFEVQMINIIVKNALRLQELSEHILDVSRIESGVLHLQKEKIDLSKLVRDIVEDFRSQVSSDVNKIELEIKEEIVSDIILLADKFRITQVLTNLLNNAIKFTEKGIIMIKMEKNGNSAVISITDSGKGISDDILPKIFEKFVTKSDSGVGMGLFITKGIVEKHGGSISAENRNDGHGAKFTITLPINS